MANSYIVHKAIELDALSTKSKEALEECNHWIVSPKYDGCHAILLFEDGNFVGALSRTGEKVYSLDHIGQSFEDNYSFPLGQVAVCGEAWIPGQEFNEISGHFRRQSGRITELYFVPFDFVEWSRTHEDAQPLLYSDIGYLDRLIALAAARKNWRMIPGRIIATQFYQEIGPLDSVVERTQGYARTLKASTIAAYDGAILARADGKYTVGAGKGGEFIKLKPTLSFTVTVTGAEIARGEKTGKNTAALLFELDGKTQRVSTGLTQAQVDEIAAEFIPVGNTFYTRWQGCRIEVGAMGKTINGFLREPRFLGVRTDA